MPRYEYPDMSTSILDRNRNPSREELQSYQLSRLNQLLKEVLRNNAFYRERYRTDSLQLDSLEALSELPLMCKSDWVHDGPSGIANHHSCPVEYYRRYHRTSGTRGRPMVILDSERDWQWWIETWQYVLDACEISNQDRVLMAFSFGPFIGFWSAHDACLRRKCMVIPSGGMSTEARIELIRSAEPTVLFSTPSYAIHLGQAARQAGKDLHHSSIRCVFVAGEPGGSIPSIRQSISELYGAVVMDHAGATEIGPWGFGSRDGTALHIIENEFIAEFLPIDQADEHLSGDPSSPVRSSSLAVHGLKSPSENAIGSGMQGARELVLTSLGRFDTPVIRYRTGDIVRPMWAQSQSQRDAWGTNFVRLEHGVLGRVDGMIVVRGVNIFPSSIEAILREFPSIGEYRLVLSKSGALDELLLEIEDRASSADALGKRLLSQLQLRIEVQQVPEGGLPRPEGKARRVLDLR